MPHYNNSTAFLREFHKISDSLHSYMELNCTTAKHGSQADEDKILASLLPESSGLYVDVGANHPWDCSNTWQFYRRGWRGILVEPIPMFQPPLLRHRPGDGVFPVAASNRAGYAVIKFNGPVSSLQADWPIETRAHIAVETMQLTEILRWFPGFMNLAIKRGGWDLCSIDVEGHERQVLEGIDFGIFRPKVMCVEYISYTDNNTGVDLSGDWESLLLDNGYKFMEQTSFNKIYQAE